MAIYHVSASLISRSGGKSVVASAAYRAGDQLTDERLGKSFDYTQKSGVDSTIILAPDNAPFWVNNRETLWNEVEAAEKRKDSQLAREFNIALPRELHKEPMKDLALAYVQEQFVNRGMIADVAFHDLNSDNPHFHVLLTLREITPLGFGLKNRSWNSKDLLVSQREAWATHVNAALEEIGRVEEKIDHRTLVAQGITDRIAQVHLGKLFKLRHRLKASGRTEELTKYNLGFEYEQIELANRQMRALHQEQQQLDTEIERSRAELERTFKKVTTQKTSPSVLEVESVATSPTPSVEAPSATLQQQLFAQLLAESPTDGDSLTWLEARSLYQRYTANPNEYALDTDVPSALGGLLNPRTAGRVVVKKGERDNLTEAQIQLVLVHNPKVPELLNTKGISEAKEYIESIIARARKEGIKPYWLSGETASLAYSTYSPRPEQIDPLLLPLAENLCPHWQQLIPNLSVNDLYRDLWVAVKAKSEGWDDDKTQRILYSSPIAQHSQYSLEYRSDLVAKANSLIDRLNLQLPEAVEPLTPPTGELDENQLAVVAQLSVAHLPTPQPITPDSNREPIEPGKIAFKSETQAQQLYQKYQQGTTSDDNFVQVAHKALLENHTLKVALFIARQNPFFKDLERLLKKRSRATEFLHLLTVKTLSTSEPENEQNFFDESERMNSETSLKILKDLAATLEALPDRLSTALQRAKSYLEKQLSFLSSSCVPIAQTTIDRPQLPEVSPSAERGTGVSPNREPDQSQHARQQLSGDPRSSAEGQRAISGVTGQARAPHTALTGRSNPNPEQSAGLGLNPALSSEWQLNRTDQGTGEQHRSMAQSSGEAEASLTEQQRQAAIATLKRLMHSLDEETFEGQRYRIQVSADYEAVEMYALDGRGLILHLKDGQISGQLTAADLECLEQLNQQLDRQQGQRQVDDCLPVLARLLNALGQYRQDNSVRDLDFDPTTQILTYRFKENPEDFLVAKQTQQGWEYLEGKLTPEREKAITEDLDQWLEQQAIEKSLGFGR